MKLSRRARRASAALAALMLLAALIVVLVPLGLRQLALHTLDAAGIQARIGDIDVNLFTGTVEVTDAHGENAAGDGFDISRLALQLQYVPLFSRRLQFSRIALSDARIDIHRAADNTLRVAGVPILSGSNSDRDTDLDWDIGLEQLRLDALRLVYSQPGANGQPPLKRELKLDRSSADDVITWQPDKPVPIDIDMTAGSSRVRIKGEVTLFGAGFGGELDLVTENFSLNLIAPLTQRSGLRELTGTVDSNVRIELAYRAGNALNLVVEGKTQWHDSRLDRANELRATSRLSDWQGRIDLNLLRTNRQPATVDTDGRLAVTNLDVRQPEAFTLSQQHAAWQGTTRLELAANGSRFSSDGQLDARGVHLDVADTATFDADRLDWTGTAQATIDSRLMQRGEGRLEAEDAALILNATPLAIRAGDIGFRGRYRREANAAGAQPTLNLEGALDTANLRAVNTRIGAYWAAAASARAEALSIRGLDGMRLDRLEADNLRVFERIGNTGEDMDRAAVFQADRAVARTLSLDGLSAYGIGDLALTHSDFWIVRETGQSGSFGRFFTDDGQDNNKNDETGSTLRIDKTTIDGSSDLYYRDYGVTPAAALHLDAIALTLEDLDTAHPEQPSRYRLSADLGEYGRLASRGEIAALSADGPDLTLKAWIRSLNLPPLSGYMVAALNRGIARGTFDGNLDLKATDGDLKGNLDVTLSNFHLGAGNSERAEAKLGVSLDTALSLVRSENDTIIFSTAILGDFTQPYFSINNLFREALYAGLRKAVTSYYSPLGLLNAAKDKLLNLGQSLRFKPIDFSAGKPYISGEGRRYLAEVETKLSKRPGLALSICGHAVSADAEARSLSIAGGISADDRAELERLAAARAGAVHDYLAARGIDASRMTACTPRLDEQADAKPRVTLSL